MRFGNFLKFPKRGDLNEQGFLLISTKKKYFFNHFNDLNS
jgi:hypothetical protein